MFKSITFDSHNQGMKDVNNLRRSSQTELGEVVCSQIGSGSSRRNQIHVRLLGHDHEKGAHAGT